MKDLSVLHLDDEEPSPELIPSQLEADEQPVGQL